MLAIAAGIAAIAGLGVQHRAKLAPIVDRALSQNHAGPGNTELRPPTPIDLTGNHSIVRLGERPGLDVPAKSVSRWALNDPRFGRIEVLVPVGTTPRAAFTVALAERGFQVVR